MIASILTLVLAVTVAPADDLGRKDARIEGAVPTAPDGYRRPEGWQPKAPWPKSLAEIARDHSAEVMAEAAAQMKKVDKTNAAGSFKATGESLDTHRCPEWFIDAKLGIFIDWGPWSVASWCPYVKGARLYPDWYEMRCRPDYDGSANTSAVAYHQKNWGKDFMCDHFLDLFRGEKFDAPALMRLFRDCGARYVVPFLKHHGGFCLWNCSYTFRDTVDMGAHRDFAREIADACRANGLKFGFYDSQATEWEYPILQEDGSIRISRESKPKLEPYSADMEWKCSGKVAVRDFVRDYIVPQATEFIDKYDPDIFWGDYDWVTPADKNGTYDIAAYLYNRAEGRKEVAMNDRYGCGTPEEIARYGGLRHRLIGLRTIRGDFYTDESGDTAADIDPAKWHPWESCSGISKSYGNHWMESFDRSMVLSEREFLVHFADIVARGGNLLLLVNLDPQGEMPSVQRERLQQIGEWLRTNGEAIYGTRICAPYRTDDVDYTQAKDGLSTYAIVKNPTSELTLGCAVPEGSRVTELASGRELKVVRDGVGVRVRLPADLASAKLPFVLKCSRPRVVLPEKYHRDPGADFALVFVTDLAEPTEAVRSFAEDYRDAVFVCAKDADRAALLKEVCGNYRVRRSPRGRIDLTSSDLAKPEAKKCLENYIRWGRYQAEPPVLTRYGARVYRRDRKAGDEPSVRLPEPWRLVEGDDGVTGCDSRLYYFTVEADGAGLPPPEVKIAWPGVTISSVDGATNVRFTADGVVLTPKAKSGGANYLTMVREGAIELALHHHVEGAQHGPYGGRPLPWEKIRASDNWRAACREIFRRAGLADPKAADGASIKLYGFDSNFPNHHVDHPEHFHVMLEWDGWQKNNVGHYTLDEKGFIRGNNFLVCGDVAGGLPKGYHAQKPGETTEYVGPSGRPLFSLEMLEGGVGLILRKPGSDRIWRVQSDRPAESVRMSVRSSAASDWEDLGSYSVTDDTEQGRYVIHHEDKGELRAETFRYERDTGRLFAADWIGDGEMDRVEAGFYDEDPAPEFTASFVLPRGASSAEVTIACAGYYALELNGRAAGVSATTLMPLWSPFDHTIYADTFVAEGLLPFPATNVVSVTLGNGFYNLPPLRFWGSKCFRTSLAYGRPCFKLSVKGIAEPLRWTCRKTNIVRNCVYLGAEVDATRGTTDERPAACVFGPKGAIVPRRAPAVDFLGEAEGRLIARPDGTYLVDFGTNLSGVPQFVFADEPRGRKIEIVYGERLNADGSVNVLTQTAGQIKRNRRGGPGAPCPACQRDAYVCGGAAEETFEPPFTWHIGRYAEIRGATHEPRSAKLKIVSSALKAVADPDKVAPEFKELHEVCVRTFRDNLIGVQSDCPGRERLGYGGDIVATCEAMCLNFDMLEFYLKTLQDFADEAKDNGWITETAPFVGIADSKGLEAGGARRAGPVSWSLAVPVLMDTLLRHYPSAEERILAFYPTCARYVRLLASAHPSGLVPTCIGDHEALERAPNEVTATAHYHEFVRLTASFARRMGREADAAEFSTLAERIESAFQRAYVKDGVVANGTQSAQAIGLYLGLVPEDQRDAAKARLLEAVEEKGVAPTTGIFATRYMLMYLAENGCGDVARKIVLHAGFPGWLHMIERGATTLWETWKESDDVYSNCHPMFGSVDEWILKYGK